jgi:hypothetical protein
MDVILSPSSIKIFTSSIVCFSRIAGSSNAAGGGGGTAAASQQDLYWEFDPISGLVIRTMNDAKTAYACMSYQPNFFTYCSTNANGTASSPAQRNMDEMSTSQQTCSQNTTTSNGSASTNNNAKRRRSDRTFACRITIKALFPIVRHRNSKNIESLRIWSYYENSLDRNRNTATTKTTVNHKLHQSQPLGLEFIFTLRNTKSDPNHFSVHLNVGTNGLTNNYQRLVIHRIPIVDSAATTFGNVLNPMMYHDKDMPPSELVVSPNVLYRLLEPLQRTIEVALIIRSHTAANHETDEGGAAGRNFHNIQNSLGSVSASSFHHSDTTYDRTLTNNNNAILQATTASLLKTETACTSQDFVDFDFITGRNMNSNDKKDIPDNVNDEVILVFPIKEAKAMLQFCCSSSMMSSALQQHSESQLVHLSFHWGGQPLMIQTYNTTTTNSNNSMQDNNIASISSSTYNMQLVLATMDYQLLTSMRTTASVAQ